MKSILTRQLSSPKVYVDPIYFKQNLDDQIDDDEAPEYAEQRQSELAFQKGYFQDGISSHFSLMRSVVGI